MGTIIPLARKSVTWLSESISFCCEKFGPGVLEPGDELVGGNPALGTELVDLEVALAHPLLEQLGLGELRLVFERLELRRDVCTFEVLRVVLDELLVVAVRELLHCVHVLLQQLLAENQRLLGVDAGEDEPCALLLDLPDVGTEVGLGELELVVEEDDLGRRVLLEAVALGRSRTAWTTR